MINEHAYAELVKTTLMKIDQDLPQDNILNMMNLQYADSSLEDQSITLLVQVASWQMNPNGVLHGGIMATAFDSAFGLLIRSLSIDSIVSTITLSVSYLRAVPNNTQLLIKAQVKYLGGTIVHVRGEAFEGTVLVATSDASFIKKQKR